MAHNIIDRITLKNTQDGTLCNIDLINYNFCGEEVYFWDIYPEMGTISQSATKEEAMSSMNEFFKKSDWQKIN